MRAVLPGHRHVRGGEMRSPGVLPLLHEDAGAVRAEVLRRLPGTARQGAAASPPAASAGLGCFTQHILTANQSYTAPSTLACRVIMGAAVSVASLGVRISCQEKV